MPGCNPAASPTPQGWTPMKFARSLKFSPLGHWFCPWGKLREDCRGTFVPHIDSFLFFVEPLFCLLRKGEGKQTEPDAILCNIFDDDGVAQLQEVLQVCTCVAWQTTELVCIYHHNEASAQLKVSSSRVDSGPNDTLVIVGVE